MKDVEMILPVKLRAFEIPTCVYESQIERRYDLKELTPEALDALCDNFRGQVFARANKVDPKASPPIMSPVPPPAPAPYPPSLHEVELND